jgi:hypothetical protein
MRFKDDLIEIMKEFNKISQTEKDYLSRENKSLNEIKRFSRLLFKLKRQISFRINDISIQNDLMDFYKSLKIKHLFLINVYNHNKDFVTLVLKTFLKSKQF